jgi:large subunit ribosomal protein L18
MKNSRRQNRTRYKLKKITDRKRLSVFKSNNHIYAQVINDENGVTLASASSIEKTIRSQKKTKKELAEKIGKEIAKRSIENGIKEVAFDKGKYRYHGIVKILAEAARAAGLNF